MQGIPIQLSRSNPVMVPSPSPKLSNVIFSIIREICFLVYVLNAAKTKCHQSVSRADGEIRDHQGFHEAFLGHPAAVRFCELRHYPIGHEAGHSPEFTVLDSLSLYSLQLPSINCSKEVISTQCLRTMSWLQ